MSRGPVVLLCFLAVACSNSSLSGAGAFTPNTEVGGYLRASDDGGVDPSSIVISLSRLDQGALGCSASGASVSGPMLIISVATSDGSPVRDISYPLVAPWWANDAGGFGASVSLGVSGVFSAGSTSGTLTFDKIEPKFEGSFNATLNLVDGGTFGVLSGTFIATNCGLLPHGR
jgi:hypothetical protein